MSTPRRRLRVPTSSLILFWWGTLLMQVSLRGMGVSVWMLVPLFMGNLWIGMVLFARYES